MSILTIIIPDPKGGQASEFRPVYQVWRADEEAHAPKFEPKNARFAHDEKWRTRFLSIECARKMEHPGWRVVAVLYALASVSLPLAGLALRH